MKVIEGARMSVLAAVVLGLVAVAPIASAGNIYDVTWDGT